MTSYTARHFPIIERRKKSPLLTLRRYHKIIVNFIILTYDGVQNTFRYLLKVKKNIYFKKVVNHATKKIL